MTSPPGAPSYGVPNPHAPAALSQFAFLVGRWTARGKSLGADGEWEAVSMVWNVRYILDGWAIAGNYQTENDDGTFTTAIVDFRFYDRDAGRWVIEHLFLGPSVLESLGGGEHGGIEVDANTVTVTSEVRGLLMREVFGGISADRFTYTSAISRDDGATWRDIEISEIARAEESAC